MKYFKKLNILSKDPIFFVKTNLEISLFVSDEEISIHENQKTNYLSINYLNENGYIESSREEFDEFYKKTVSKINKISSL